MASHRTFIYDVQANSWTEGPSLFTPRVGHSSCVIQSDDGSDKCVIIIGGWTDQERFSKSTEILDLTEKKWIQGPDLAVGIKAAACVALPLSSNFACVVVGGWTKKEYYSSNVYGLDKSLTEWTFLGKIRNGRRSHIALPIS